MPRDVDAGRRSGRCGPASGAPARLGAAALAAWLAAASAGAQTGSAPAPAAASSPGTTAFGGLSFTSADEPIVVEADKLEFDYEKNRLVYRGAVHVVQGDLDLRSDVLTVTFDRADELERAELRRVEAEGDVVITQGERRASGDRAIFDQSTRQMVLVGNPVLRDGPNEVQGERLTVYLDEGRSVIESSPKGRVSAVLYPGQAPGGASPSPAGAGPTPTPTGGAPKESPGPAPSVSP